MIQSIKQKNLLLLTSQNPKYHQIGVEVEALKSKKEKPTKKRKEIPSKTETLIPFPAATDDALNNFDSMPPPAQPKKKSKTQNLGSSSSSSSSVPQPPKMSDLEENPFLVPLVPVRAPGGGKALMGTDRVGPVSGVGPEGKRAGPASSSSLLNTSVSVSQFIVLYCLSAGHN